MFMITLEFQGPKAPNTERRTDDRHKYIQTRCFMYIEEKNKLCQSQQLLANYYDDCFLFFACYLLPCSAPALALAGLCWF